MLLKRISLFRREMEFFKCTFKFSLSLPEITDNKTVP